MTKKQIKDLAKALLNEMDKEGLDMEITLDDNQLNKLADSIVDKLLSNYIRQQATWYTSTSMDELYNTFIFIVFKYTHPYIFMIISPYICNIFYIAML